MGTSDDADPRANTVSASLEAAPQSRDVLAKTSSEDGPQLLAGRYEILGMLGAGAMGTVYRARDRELDEVVALKVLKKELASADMIERFRREVKLARRVTHKNVARTFDIGEHGGDRFLTMEFVEGEMLAALLARRRRLSIPEVARLALDVCAGLSAAHEADVLHRDLKPENVVVAKDGRAVITDFGIARAVAGDASRTVGGIVGTPAYMAPEQVEGATDLDARADLYALGTMLFELLTGEMAWTGDSVVTVAAGRLLRPPPDPRSIVPNLPPDVAEVVLKLMARRREERFSSAEETARAIEDLGVTRPGVPKPAPSGTLPLAPIVKARASGARVVAVLPVLNLGASDDAYLVDSVNEDIVDSLSVVPGLLVRPRGETSRFDGPKRDVREIGRSLGVDVVVDGSIRRIGDTVRASFRLITVEDGFQLWARRFDRPPSEVLAIADDAAHAIARALTTELSAHKQPRLADAEAEDLFLRGRYLLRRGWNGGTRDAVDILARAHERASDDPRIVGNYALALARVYGHEFFERDIADRARMLAVRASELDPRQPEAKVAIATVHLTNGEVDASVRYLREALDVAPNCIDALDWLGRIAAEVGRVDEGMALLNRIVAIDIEAFTARTQLARIQSMIGRRSAALKTLGDVPTHPNDVAGWVFTLARDALWYRDLEAAKRLEGMVATLDLPPVARFPVVAILEVVMGHGERLAEPTLVDRVLPIDASRPPRRAAFNAQMRTELHLTLGQNDRALETVTIADAHGLMDVVWLRSCPLLDPIRGHAQFLAVQERVTLRAMRVVEALDARLSPPSRLT